MRTDAHTHAFHPKIADKVLKQLHNHYEIPPVGLGTVDDLLARLTAAGLERCIVHTAATTPDQVIPANNWSLDLNRRHPQIMAFGTLHPGYADREGELNRLRAAGVKGLKFHPDFQGFFLDDPRFYEIMEMAGEDFVFMLHVGDRLPPEKNPSCPYKVAKLLDNFPHARIIAAHMGGYLHWHHALRVLVGREVWLDTSSSLAFMDPGLAREILRRHPRERMLFGSDYPLFDPGMEMERLAVVGGLSESEVEDMLHHADGLF
ncbi:MAG: amidohydrolase family protein [Desulfovibrionaceae bacterium]